MSAPPLMNVRPLPFEKCLSPLSWLSADFIHISHPHLCSYFPHSYLPVPYLWIFVFLEVLSPHLLCIKVSLLASIFFNNYYQKITDYVKKLLASYIMLMSAMHTRCHQDRQKYIGKKKSPYWISFRHSQLLSSMVGASIFPYIGRLVGLSVCLSNKR